MSRSDNGQPPFSQRRLFADSVNNWRRRMLKIGLVAGRVFVVSTTDNPDSATCPTLHHQSQCSAPIQEALNLLSVHAFQTEVGEPGAALVCRRLPGRRECSCNH